MLNWNLNSHSTTTSTLSCSKLKLHQIMSKVCHWVFTSQVMGYFLFVLFFFPSAANSIIFFEFTGRTNQVQLAMLPKGEWPKWWHMELFLWVHSMINSSNFGLPSTALNHYCRCRTCGGSGLSYCSRCLGTGEYRYIMGFHFMKMDNDHTQDQKKYEVQGNQERRSAADLLLNEE